MCREVVSCAYFKAILTPFSGVIWNRNSSVSCADFIRDLKIRDATAVRRGRNILVPRAYDPSGLRQESRALGATILK